MQKASLDRREELLARLNQVLEERLEDHQVALVQDFTQRYFVTLASEDVLATTLEDHYGSVLGLWEWFVRRPAGSVQLRAFNPTVDEHGWRCVHTIIDVLADDRPFLVDSLSMELVRNGLTVHSVSHPVLWVERDDVGRVRRLGHGGAEALLRFEVDHQDRRDVTDRLLDALRRVLADVDAAVADWRAMRDRMLSAVEDLRNRTLPVADEQRDEALAFLEWAARDHFTFIGSRVYDLMDGSDGDVLRLVADSGLGVMRNSEAGHESEGFAQMPAELRALAHQPDILVLTKSTARSTIHRPAHLDYIGVKRFDASGAVVGEWRFLGLYSSSAYSARPSEIPLLRVRREQVMKGSGLELGSHDGKALQHVIDTYPRDELFQCGADELLRITMGILRVEERHRLRMFLRRDPFARFVTVLVYVPRDRYDTALRRHMQAILAEGMGGDSSEFDVLFSDSVMARVHFTVHTPGGGVAEPDVAALEERMADSMLSWDDKLLAALLEQFGEAEGNRLHQRFYGGFPAAYRDDYRPRNAALDAHRLDGLNSENPLAMQLYRPLESGGERLRFKVFGLDRPMALSDGLPMLERMGLTVIGARPYVISRADDECFWVLDFDLSADRRVAVDVAVVRDAFQDAFARVYAGDMENDGFNRLILAAGLNWREVVLLRSLCKYLLQAGSPFSQSYMEDSLAVNPGIARLLVQLFEARFDPRRQGERQADVEDLAGQVEAALEQVANLDQDRILRRFLHTVRAVLRSNFYQCDVHGKPKPYLSIKLDPARVPDLPEPRPRFEIFVYSPWVEGVHLRGGKVARGGLRWSDRREDFRTEVLGLMKAQMVKNAVIVPVGAKGGFVPKRLPSGDRAAIQAEGIRCYRTFVSGLLDLTDNRVGGSVVPPPDVLCYDEDDPYLVVAADKGTASFSDIANAISIDYGFWLGDAFASGGAHGYDHKRMGITARGGWESVKRHFRELGLNIQDDPVTAVGIGDMSGDVFGNAMLLSRRVRLVAAFNHLHIFLDPDPNPETSFEERQRLFGQAGSSWSDYDPAFISKGGGVFARSAKSIPISPEVRALLGFDAARMAPNELMRAILKAPVDLLWNGGIGTYVKAGGERNAEVGDRANDNLRVDAAELRCKVVGEGGNLGLTQLARVEFARLGGLLNTDAVDNSAGVDCSDHEVNIKILLDRVVDAGDMTVKQRNGLLADMTEEVAGLVLRHNYLQTQSISVSSINARQRFMEHIRLMRILEREGRLVRALEFLPDDKQLAERDASGEGFTRPELAVLLAYAKIRLYDELLAADVARDTSLRDNLPGYFPTALRDRFAERTFSHPLAGEIVANVLTNEIVNRMGANFCVHIEEETGEDAVDIARAYVVGREIFALQNLWSRVEKLDNCVAARDQSTALAESRRLLARVTLWLLRNRRPPLDVTREIEFYQTGIAEVRGGLSELLPQALAQVYDEDRTALEGQGMPADLAADLAWMDLAYSSLDIVEVARQTECPVVAVAQAYFDLGVTLDLHWVRERIRELPRHSHWQSQARASLRDELYIELRGITAQLLRSTPGGIASAERVARWLEANQHGVERCRALINDLKTAGQPDLAMLSVAVREIRNLARDGGS